MEQITEALELVENDEVGFEHRQATARQRPPQARDELIARMPVLVGDKTLAGASEKFDLRFEIGSKRRIGDQRLLEALDDRRFKTPLLVGFGLHLIEQASPALHASIGLKKVLGSGAAQGPDVGEKPIENSAFPPRAAARAKVEGRARREGNEVDLALV